MRGHVPYRFRPPEYVRLLALAVDAKASYFPSHSDGVAYLVRLMASESGMPDDEVHRLTTAAVLHDVGKIMTPDAILNAERKLTVDEFEIMKLHSIDSWLIAKSTAGLAYCAPWVRAHHERWDGRGYPDGLAGHDIPIQSRMIFVADAFHVMTSDRPYQRAVTRREALAELRRHSGTQFCPTCVEIIHSIDTAGSQVAA